MLNHTVLRNCFYYDHPLYWSSYMDFARGLFCYIHESNLYFTFGFHSKFQLRIITYSYSHKLFALINMHSKSKQTWSHNCKCYRIYYFCIWIYPRLYRKRIHFFVILLYILFQIKYRRTLDFPQMWYCSQCNKSYCDMKDKIRGSCNLSC